MTVGRAALTLAACLAAGASAGALGGLVPWPIALLAALFWGLIIVLGVLSPRLEMFARVLWCGPVGVRAVALTFDDGPHPEHTPKVLDALARAGVKATFFVLGHKARRYPEVLERIARDGHTVGIHGDAHDRLVGLRSAARVREDLERALDTVERITAVRPRLYRPAVGQVSPHVARAAREAGLGLVGWSVRAFDGVSGSPSAVARRVLRRLEPGAIVLLHDAAERDDHDPVGPRALDEILRGLEARGLASETLDAWSTGATTESRRR